MNDYVAAVQMGKEGTVMQNENILLPKIGINIIGFYNPEDEYGCFSNWYQSPFEYAGVKYCCIEQYMMYQKMGAFGQKEICEKIMASNDPGTIKKLGRSPIDNWDGALWDKISYAVVKRAVRAKVVQNPEIYERLLTTGHLILAECSPKDLKWGIGVGIDDPKRFDVESWSGRNYLGRILMEIREELRLLEHIGRGYRRPEYRDARSWEPIGPMYMSIGELLKMPKYRDMVMPYYETACLKMGKGSGGTLRGMTLSEAEELVRKGTIPGFGFFDMKQDICETVNYMWVLASGFDAPAYGTVID